MLKRALVILSLLLLVSVPSFAFLGRDREDDSRRESSNSSKEKSSKKKSGNSGEEFLESIKKRLDDERRRDTEKGNSLSHLFIDDFELIHDDRNLVFLVTGLVYRLNLTNNGSIKATFSITIELASPDFIKHKDIDVKRLIKMVEQDTAVKDLALSINDKVYRGELQKDKANLDVKMGVFSIPVEIEVFDVNELYNILNNINRAKTAETIKYTTLNNDLKVVGKKKIKGLFRYLKKYGRSFNIKWREKSEKGR